MADKGQKPGGVFPELRFGFGREHNQNGLGFRPAGPWFRLTVFGNNHVGVGPAGTKGGEAGDPGATVRGLPLRYLLLDGKWGFFKIDQGIDLFGVQGGNQHAVF